MVTVTKTVMVTNTPPPSVARAALGSSKLPLGTILYVNIDWNVRARSKLAIVFAINKI